MNFHLNEEQDAIVQLARRIAQEQVAPRAALMDETGEYPAELHAIFRDAGLLALGVPEEYGGAGQGCMGVVLAVEEVAKYCCASGLALLLTRLPLMAILLAGTEEQKRYYAGGIARGELRGAFCLSEPDAGSDVAAIRTRAVKRGDRYIINGTKSWISGSTLADFYTVAAVTDPRAGRGGFTVFVVPRQTPGVSLGAHEKKMGVKGLPVSQVIFEEAEVPAANIIGAENQGFKLIMHNLNAVRPVVAARGIGLAEGALMYAREYTRTRHTFGKPVIAHQGIQWMMADLATQIEAARLLTYRAALMVDAGRTGKEAAPFLSMAKYCATELAVRAANDCLQMLGANGYMADYPLERFYRDAKQLTIVEGTSQIQKGIIGGAVADGTVTW